MPSRNTIYGVVALTSNQTSHNALNGQMGVLQREDIAPGAAKVALTGQRCTEWPPLQVDPLSGVPTMEDRDTLGARIEQQGPFYNYYITWPGNRLPMDDLREVRRRFNYRP